MNYQIRALGALGEIVQPMSELSELDPSMLPDPTDPRISDALDAALADPQARAFASKLAANLRPATRTKLYEVIGCPSSSSSHLLLAGAGGVAVGLLAGFLLSR